MKRAWWLNALLALAVAALAAIAYLKPGREPADHALSTLRPAGAGVVRIERAGGAAIALERKGDAWFLTAPIAARADAARVARLLAILEARSATRLAPGALARFELDPPAARLDVDGQRFDFGMVSQVTREQYVLTGGAVYMVSIQYGGALPAGPGELIDKRLLAADESPVSVTLPGYVVARHDGKWTLAPATGTPPSQEAFQRWIDGWRHAGAARVERLEQVNPAGDIVVKLQNGRTLTLAILAREPVLVLMRADEKLAYHFLGASGARLLAPPADTPEEPAGRK